MNKRWWIVLGVVVALLGLAGPFLAAVTNTEKPDQQTPPLDLASTSATNYLKAYVGVDGKVVVTGSNETQAQAQAWALLIAAASSDSARFASLLSWTNANLRQTNGSYVAADATHGAEVDLDIAWSLAVASKRLSNPAYTTQAAEAATNLFNNRLMTSAMGLLLYSRGPNTDGVFTVESGDVFQRALQQVQPTAPTLAWPAVADGQRLLITTITNSGLLLPYGPMELKAGAEASKALDTATYTAGAQSVPLNLATSCHPTDTAQAKQIWTKLRESRETRVAKELSVQGKVINASAAVRATVASAAAAQSINEALQSSELLDDADGIQAKSPSSEGGAWAALGRILLSTPWLGSCS